MKKIGLILLGMMLLALQCEKDTSGPDPDPYYTPENIHKVTVEYLFDNCTYRLEHKKVVLPGMPKYETFTGKEHNASFTSISGAQEGGKDWFESTWGSSVLGQYISGNMSVYFKSNNNLNLTLAQWRSYTSVVKGDVVLSFKIRADGMSVSERTTEDGYPVDVYKWTGSNACKAIVSYMETNRDYIDQLMQIGCGSRAEVVVKVYYKS